MNDVMPASGVVAIRPTHSAAVIITSVKSTVITWMKAL